MHYYLWLSGARACKEGRRPLLLIDSDDPREGPIGISLGSPSLSEYEYSLGRSESNKIDLILRILEIDPRLL